MESSNKIYSGNILGNLGDLYEKQGNITKSRAYKIRAYNLFQETENPILIFKSGRILGNDYIITNELAKAKSLLISLLSDTAFVPLDKQINLFSVLTKVYKELNKTDSALYYHEIYSDLSIKLQRIRNFKATEELIIAHKTEQALKENQLLSIKYKVQLKRHYLLIVVAVVIS